MKMNILGNLEANIIFEKKLQKNEASNLRQVLTILANYFRRHYHYK